MFLPEKFQLFMFSTDMIFWFLLLWMFLMVEIGWRVGYHLAKSYHVEKVDSSDTFMAAIFGLMALLVAFTFSGASDRFDQRRHLIANEVSTIGTAYQSIDLLSPKEQPKIREVFKNYLDTRIVIYQFDSEGTISPLEIESRTQKHSAVGDQLWKEVVRAVGDTQYPQKLVAAQILPQLSDMFTASDNQRLSIKFHPPIIIFQSLILLCMIGALIAGYNLGIQKQRDWFLTLVFVVLMTGTIFIILSLEFSRMGKISLNNFEMEFISLRKSF
jgi:hypothetical protein